MSNGSKGSTTRKGDREIISVSLPVHIYDAMQELIDRYDMNRSALVTRAIVDYIRSFGIRVGEN
jgi:metal-responsive CopG/Arc/MetJ family transcriptional regulator